MKGIEKQQLEDFNLAKAIALSIGDGMMRRAANISGATNYSGAKLGGRMFVIGDTESDIKNPDAIIMGKPAREVFGDFVVMSK